MVGAAFPPDGIRTHVASQTPKIAGLTESFRQRLEQAGRHAVESSTAGGGGELGISSNFRASILKEYLISGGGGINKSRKNSKVKLEI